MSNLYTDDQKVQIAKKEYDPLKIKDKVAIDNMTSVGYVSQINDKSTGEQSFVIY
ncbi:hypothetical protein ACWOFR_00855 [Carnobacterium gallinarum]|uniref:hypothetical protein n=1 Tax=Carnobacterium gallinarum TaxID=2749 RepID=UPI000AFD135F|nr:hypothetical protein [Carnobacterium gallinarum]